MTVRKIFKQFGETQGLVFGDLSIPSRASAHIVKKFAENVGHAPSTDVLIIFIRVFN